MKYAFVEFSGSKNERLFMSVRDYERYEHDNFIHNQVFNGNPELVIYDHIYIGCFSLIDFVKNICKYNPECVVKTRIKLNDICFLNNSVSCVVKMLDKNIEL